MKHLLPLILFLATFPAQAQLFYDVGGSGFNDEDNALAVPDTGLTGTAFPEEKEKTQAPEMPFEQIVSKEIQERIRFLYRRRTRRSAVFRHRPQKPQKTQCDH